MCIFCEKQKDQNEEPNYLDKGEGMLISCSNCPLIKIIPMIQGLIKLDCSRCDSLTDIPVINGLKILDCSYNKSLTRIPMIDGLEELYCIWCPQLRKIPKIESLTILSCFSCKSLTYIPRLPNLGYLNCQDCDMLTDISMNQGSYWTSAHFCKWLKENDGIDENVSKLVILQKWFKGILMSKKLLKLINQLIPLYYHPDAKGGYFHKKYMLEFLDKI